MAVFTPAIWSWNLTGRGKGVKVCRCPSLWLRVRGIDPRDGYENTDPPFLWHSRPFPHQALPMSGPSPTAPYLHTSR